MGETFAHQTPMNDLKSEVEKERESQAKHNERINKIEKRYLYTTIELHGLS